MGVQATVEISADRLVEMRKNEIRSQSLASQVKSVLWNRQTIGQVLRVPIIRGSLMFAKRLVPESRRRALKARFLGAGNRRGATQSNASRGRMPAAGGGPIHVPDETLLALYKPQTHVRIDKARELLGYEPAIDFERGMDLTARFIHWANLA